MGKQGTPTWSQVKAGLLWLDQKDLLNIIRDLYRLSVDNRVMLTSRLGLAVPRSLVEPFRRAIRREFYPDRGLPRLNLKAARKALNDFRKVSADARAMADLLVYYVEQGVACTIQYGDTDARFYSSLESAFEEAVVLVREIGDAEVVEDLLQRMESIVRDTRSIGWGFHDYVAQVFYNEYPPE